MDAHSQVNFPHPFRRVECIYIYARVPAHGADVLFVTSPNLPSLPLLDTETSRGKRTTQLDLNVPADADKLRELIGDADVFLQSYRPGGLAARGFSHEDCAAMRPGIVHASIAAFSLGGPWQDVKSVRPAPLTPLS